MTQFTESQLKLIDKINFHAGDLKTGAELGQFLIEDIEAIRKACDELEKEMREWITPDRYKEIDPDENGFVWGWSKADRVRRWWKSFFEDEGFFTPSNGEDYMTMAWDREHQPTHIMLYVSGEEPPAPPEVNDVG